VFEVNSQATGWILSSSGEYSSVMSSDQPQGLGMRGLDKQFSKSKPSDSSSGEIREQARWEGVIRRFSEYRDKLSRD